jgi:hypothetical protein
VHLLAAPLAPLGSQALPGMPTPTRSSWAAGRSSTLRVKDVNRASASLGRSSVIRSGGSKSGFQTNTLRALEEESVAVAIPADPVLLAADWLRLDLFGNFSRNMPALKADPEGATSVRTWGLVRYEWPRCEIVNRTARVVSGVMLDHWVSPDPGRAREIVPAWTAQLWSRLGLDLEGFVEHLRHSADKVFDADAEKLLRQIGDTVQPKGWLNRTPDAAQVGNALVQWEKYIGHPVASANRIATPIEEAIRLTAADLATAAQAELASSVPRLIDDPAYRLAGAEEAARQLLADLSKKVAALNTQADQLDAAALLNHDAMAAHAHGTARIAANVLAEALKEYPRQRFQATLARRAARTYAALKDSLTIIKNDVAGCRQRMLGYKAVLLGEMDQPIPPPGPHVVMPVGCASIEEAAKRYLDVLTDDDLQEMETAVQRGVEAACGGLYEACLNTGETGSILLGILRREARAYLDARLGDVDLAAMFDQKFGSPHLVADAFRSDFQEAEPSLVEPGPWSREATAIFAAPEGESGSRLREAAESVAEAELRHVTLPDEVVFFREYHRVPLAALPHFGPAWQAAYDSAAETLQCSPHTRIDVAQWRPIDGD